MANTSSAAYEAKLTVSETLDLGLDTVSANPTVTHILGGDSGTLTDETTPAVTKTSSGTLTLSSGSGTIDLTAANGANGSSDGKIQLGPGDWVTMLLNNSAPDVDSSNKVIDFASSDLDAVVDYILVGG